MNAALRDLGAAVLAVALLLPAAGAHAQIAYRAGSAVSALSTDVQYVGAGSYAGANSGNIVSPLPPGWQVNDFWLAVIESKDNVASTMPAGWTLLSQASGAGGLHQATLFWKRAAAGDTNPTITHPGGGRITAKIVGFRRVDLDQPFDVLHSFTGSAADTTTEAASITTVTQSRLVFTAHNGAYRSAAGTLTGSSPWTLGTFSIQGSAGDGVSIELHFSSNMVNAGTQAALTLTRAEAGESHGALIALRPDKKLIVTRPGSVAQNDLMLAAVGRWGTGSVTAPSGWTLVRRTESGGGALEVFYKVAGASEPASYTFTAEAKGGAALGMQVFSGVDAANPIDVENGAATASGLAHAAPGLTTTVANTMLVSSHTFMASDAWSPPSGMTETVDVSTYPGPVAWGLSLEMNYAAQAAAGATGDKTATVTIADNGYTHLLALRPGTNAAKLYFIHTDHLNTPRLVADSAGAAVWRWDQVEPFGGNVPDESPSGPGAFEFPLRFSGQYADKETGLYYNYFRDYDPGLGIYKQSDPIGLAGGLNTYAYVYDDPLRFVDPEGLEVAFVCRPVQGARRYSHCFVHVTCPPEGIDVTLSLFGKFPYLRSTGYKSVATPQTYINNPEYPDNPNSPNNTSRTVISPKGSNCDCAYEKGVIAKFNAAPATQPYNAALNNSNTFAQSLVTSPQFGTILPPTVPQNAPGIFPSAVGAIR